MPPLAKGKSRPLRDPALERTAAAIAAERTPLLHNGVDSESSSTYSAEYTVDTPATGHSHRRTRRFAVLAVAGSLILGLAIFITLILVASLIPDKTDQAHLQLAFKYTDPQVDILNVTDDGVHVNVTFHGAVDVNVALRLDDSKDASWWQTLRRGTAHAVLGVLPTQAVHVNVPEVLLYAATGASVGLDNLPLLNVSLPGQVVVPLTHGELLPLSIEAVGTPVAPVGKLWTWGQQVWANGTLDVVISVREAQASVPGAWWSKWATVTQRDLSVPLQMPVPAVPNFPPPGRPLNLTRLVTLHEYALSNNAGGIKIAATASVPNPSLRSVPFALPFAILVEGTIMAQVVARASRVTTSTIEIQLSGDVSTLANSEPLNNLLQHYLRGEGSPITVRGHGAMPHGYEHSDIPPPWVLKTLPSLSVDLEFPGPNPKPEIVKQVTIEGMKIGEANGQMIASGTVVADVELPRGLEQIHINVTAIKPDVMVSDGVEDDQGGDEYDPENPPPKAFGRISPDVFLNSTTEPGTDPNRPDILIVRAPFTDLALDVLPGRDGILRGFVSKVVFKGGAMAGIGGVADIEADLFSGGLLQVGGLPVHGEFWVKR